MPVNQPIPAAVVDSIANLLRAYHSCPDGQPSARWFNHLLGQACRHIEFFVTPLASVEAAKHWASVGGSGPLTQQPYKKPSKWQQGAQLYFEHAVPADDLKKALLNLGPKPDKQAILSVLSQAEIVWITRDEEVRLRRALTANRKVPRGDWRAVYRQAQIKVDETS